MNQKLSLWRKYLISKELTGKKLLSLGKIEQMIVRQPPSNIWYKLHPMTRHRFNKAIKQPKPLAFKLQDYTPIAINKPLGGVNLPFKVERTYSTNNLPVYTDYSQRHQIKRTIIRRVSGDVSKLKEELKKITSNSNVTIQTGKIVISGLHTEVVKNYLYRLGF